jgi:hypothetical protein
MCSYTAFTTHDRGGTPTFHSAAQTGVWADGDFDADHGFAFDGVGRSAPSQQRSRHKARAQLQPDRAALATAGGLFLRFESEEKAPPKKKKRRRTVHICAAISQ